MHQKLTKSVDVAVQTLRRGGVIGAPTDTLYGVLANALDEAAVERVFSVKGRRTASPLPVFISDPADLATYAQDIPEVAWKLASAFWPGALTIVVRRSCTVPDLVAGGLSTIGLRIPDHEVPVAIVKALGAPVTATSANLSGHPPSTSADAVIRTIGERLDLVVDGGHLVPSEPSTVIDVTVHPPRILREGAVTTEQIVQVTGIDCRV